jgi:hypothetical protein
MAVSLMSGLIRPQTHNTTLTLLLLKETTFSIEFNLNMLNKSFSKKTNLSDEQVTKLHRQST